MSATAAPVIKSFEEIMKGLDGIVPAGHKAGGMTHEVAEQFKEFGEMLKIGIEDPIGVAKGALMAIVDALGPFGIALTAVVGVVALVGTELFELGEKAAAVGGSLQDLSIKTGMSVPGLSRLRVAAQVAGTDVEKLGNAVFIMQKRMENNPDQFNRGLEKLNINVREFQDMSPDDKLIEFAEALKKTEDPAARISAGFDVMGRQFRDLSPALAKLDEALEMTAGIEPFTKEEAENAEKFEMMMASIKVRLEEVGLTVGRAVLPVMMELTKETVSLTGAVANQLVTVTGLKAMWQTTAYVMGLARAAADELGGVHEKLPEVTGNAANGLKRLAEETKKYTDEGNAEKITAREQAEAISELNKVHTEQVRAVKAAAAEFEKHTDAVKKLESGFAGLHTSVGLANKDEIDLLKNLTRSTDAIDQIEKKAWIASFGFRGMSDQLQTLGTKSSTELDTVAARLRIVNNVERTIPAGFYDIGVALDTLGLKSTEIDELKQKLANAKGTSLDFGAAIRDLGGDFAQLAQISDGSLSPVLRITGEMIKSFDMISKGVELVGSAMQDIGTHGFNAANLATLAAGWIGIVIAIYQALSALNDYLKEQRELQKVAQNIRVVQDEFNTLTRISETLAKTIQGDFETLLKAGTDASYMFLQAAAFALNLNAIVKELGGYSNLTAGEMEGVNRALRVLIQLATSPELGVAPRAIKELDDALYGIATAAVEGGNLVSKEFLAIVAEAEAAGIKLEKVNEFMLDQLKSAAQGLNSILIGLQASATAAAQEAARKTGEMTEDEISKIVGVFTVTQAQGAGLAAAVAADFAAMIERGMSFKDALALLAPSIEILRAALERSGVDGGAAFKFLSELAKAAADPINGPLFDAINGVNQALRGLWNSGILTQEMFTGLVATATDTFKKLILSGVDANVVMMMMSPTLQTIWELWKDQGFAIDDATKALLEEAEAQGRVGDSHRSVASQMLIATKEIAEAVRALARAFGVDLPESAEEAAKRIKGAMKDAGDFTRDTILALPKWSTGGTGTGTGGGGGGGGGGGPVVVAPDDGGGGGMHDGFTGGLVTARGIMQYLGNGGNVLPFIPKGTDTVPAMLTPGERVLSIQENSRYEGRGGPSSVRDDQVHQAISRMSHDLTRLLQDNPRALAIALSDALVLNRRVA